MAYFGVACSAVLHLFFPVNIILSEESDSSKKIFFLWLVQVHCLSYLFLYNKTLLDLVAYDNNCLICLVFCGSVVWGGMDGSSPGLVWDHLQLQAAGGLAGSWLIWDLSQGMFLLFVVLCPTG